MRKTLMIVLLSPVILYLQSCRVIVGSGLVAALDSTYNATSKRNSFCIGYSYGYSSMLTSITDNTLQYLKKMVGNIQLRKYRQDEIQTYGDNGKYYDINGKEVILPPIIKKSDIYWFPYDCLWYWRPIITNVKYEGEDITAEKSLTNQWFSPQNMLRNITFDFRCGWQNRYSTFVPYVSAKYNFHSVYTRFPNDEERLKNKIHSACFGGGIQLLPFKKKAARNQWRICPALEIGTEYELYTKCRSYYGKDKKQFKNGMNMHYGIGANMFGVCITMITADIGGHDIFNTEYSPDGISKPFKDIKSNKYSVGMTTVIYF